MSAASDSAALASLEQAVLANPAWPAIPGKNKWGALPPELQPIMAEIDETIWDVSVDFWVNLVIVGIIGFDWLASLPSDIIYVFWPELRRVMGWKNGHLGSLPLGSAPLLSPQGKDMPRRRQRRWPYPIIVCHLLARIVAPIYMAATINNYRTPPSCHDAFIAYLVIVAVAACNGQVMLTLRAVAITHPLPYHRIICIVLWVLNVVIAAAWLAFAFTSQPTGNLATPVPFGFRFGFICGPNMVHRSLPMIIYPVTFMQDSIVFVLTLACLSSVPAPGMQHVTKVHWIDRWRAWRQTLREAFMRLVGLDDILGSGSKGAGTTSSVATQFIADGAQVVLVSWTLELLGIIMVAHWMFGGNNYTNKAGIALALHGLSLVIIPKTVVSLKRVALLDEYHLQVGDIERAYQPTDETDSHLPLPSAMPVAPRPEAASSDVTQTSIQRRVEAERDSDQPYGGGPVLARAPHATTTAACPPGLGTGRAFSSYRLLALSTQQPLIPIPPGTEGPRFSREPGSAGGAHDSSNHTRTSSLHGAKQSRSMAASSRERKASSLSWDLRQPSSSEHDDAPDRAAGGMPGPLA